MGRRAQRCSELDICQALQKVELWDVQLCSGAGRPGSEPMEPQSGGPVMLSLKRRGSRAGNIALF